MSAAGAAETWDQWTARIADELTDLTEGEWLTITAAPDGSAGRSPGAAESQGSPRPYAAGAPVRERRWPLRRSGSTAPGAEPRPVADVFLQARLVEGVLALECISDTEFEGLSDLSTEQEQALVALGWEQQGREPAFERTYALEGAEPAVEEPADETTAEATTDAANQAATEAASLLRRSLDQVLGALSPADIVLRRSTTAPPAG
ncbi:hypothetical protein FHX52_2674 [Humibacillus xanthopallidus]|uniref:TY-Chap N-terminal domain-containing protein n=1 Tax=Humibacillus xanthopallidus TaxID=412689 RepID=A0A543PPH8_9MICO|nr:hypothetical protein [Humibacillus xanthopallidus]TQN45969.1 hypothetical protein FHX52_2674 [Humibacillus xanthopallidus]